MLTQQERYLSWILKGGLFLTPFLVFIVSRSLYFPFITGKNFAFRMIVELLAVVWCYAALRFQNFRPRPSPVLWAVLAFALVLGLADLFGIAPYRSFWSNFERMEGLISILHLVGYFLILGAVLRTERDWRQFFLVSLCASVVVGLHAVWQVLGLAEIHQGGTRVDASLGNATYLAAYVLFHIFFSLWFLLRAARPWQRYLLGVLILLHLTVLYFTATRGAILGLLGGLTIFAAIIVWKGQGLARKISLAGLLFALALPLLFFSVRNTTFVRGNPVLARFASISFTETTTQSRFTIWRMALEGAKERPILGWGQENFLYVFSKYYDPSLWRQEPWFDRAHNVFLDWLIAGGALGLTAYLAIYAASGRLLFRVWRRGATDLATAGVFISLLAAHFFENLFVFDNLTSYLLFFAVIAYIHALAVRDRPGYQGRMIPGGAALGASVAVAVLMSGVIYAANIKPIRAASDILDALRNAAMAPPAGKIDLVVEDFRRGIALNTFGTMELREQLAQNAVSATRDQSLANQDKAKFLDYAISELEQQEQDFPYDMRAKAFLGTLYVTAGRFADAVNLMQEALAISSRRQQYYFIAAEAYFNANQTRAAVEALQKAYELAPEYPEAALNLAIVLILTQQYETAEAVLTESFGTPIVPEERLGQSWVQVGQFDKAAKIWERLVESAPHNFRWFASLGVSYARSGRPEDGIRAIERAIELEPQFASQGESIIAGIRSGEIK